MKIANAIQTMPSGQTSIMRIPINNVCANFVSEHLTYCYIISYNDFRQIGLRYELIYSIIYYMFL